MALRPPKPPPVPELRVGFRIIHSWEINADKRGWTLWLGENAAGAVPIVAPHDATQAEVDRYAFIACRRIDEAAGRPVRK